MTQSVLVTGLVVLACIMRLTTGQQILTEAERLALQEEKAQVTFNNFYSFAVAHKAPIKQLDLTDSEALDVCNSTVLGGTRFKGHLKTCAAYVECDTRKKNPFRINTVYRIQAYIRTTAEQTFWDPVINAAVLWNTNNNCPSDPCKTGKPITDGRSCYTYLVCVRSPLNNAPEGYQQLECPTNSSFDVASGACVADPTCRKPQGDRFVNLYCNASVPAVQTPGLPPQAYFNRTYLDLDDNKVKTEATFCPAGLVFNNVQPVNCECVAPTQVPDTCPKTLFSYGSQASSEAQMWNTTNQECNAAIDSRTGSTFQWVRFQGQELDCFHATVLANNELTGPFVLSLSFLYEGASAGTIALVSNSRDSATCPAASLRVYMSFPRSVIVAEATNVNGVTVSVESQAITNLLNRAVSFRLERRTDGRLALTVDSNPAVVSSASLDNIRLRSTNCGLFLAKNNGQESFVGVMNNFSLVKNC